ncbi:MAG TPA: 3-isopropylmalate dehydratase small subunit [Candidatus Cybelea sp.]|nr:3-isopropylmalate dehydratase small subunit [Candidatus Cybelea sp.]
MEKFESLIALAAPLLRPNIDTDTIIPMELLLTVERKNLGPHALTPLRYAKDGTENPDFVLNRPGYRGARILIAGVNFGCGSSREPAVWALWAAGIRCVIAPSFGDIFFNNCFKNGMLPIVLPQSTVEDLAAAALPGSTFRVDLSTCVITTPAGRRVQFEVDPANREALLTGLDEIGMTLQQDATIAAFERNDRQRRPWIHL